MNGGCRVGTSSVLGAEKHHLSILSPSHTCLPLSFHCHLPSSSPPFPPLLHPSLYPPFYHSFISPSLISCPSPLHPIPLPPFLSHLSSHLAPGELRSPQQMSRDSPFRIQVQRQRQNRFFLLTFYFQHPQIVLASLSTCPVPATHPWVTPGQLRDNLRQPALVAVPGVSGVGLEGDFTRLGDVQASGDSQRCLEWLHPWTLPNVAACPCSLGAGDGLGVPVLPPSRQIYSDSFVTWAAAEPGRLCGALGCSGLWGAEPCAACRGWGCAPGQSHSMLPKTPVEYSLTFDFLLMARVTLVPLIR